MEQRAEGGVGGILHHRVNKQRQKRSLGMSFAVLEHQHTKLKPPPHLPHPPRPPAAKQHGRDERDGGRWASEAVLLLRTVLASTVNYLLTGVNSTSPGMGSEMTPAALGEFSKV